MHPRSPPSFAFGLGLVLGACAQGSADQVLPVAATDAGWDRLQVHASCDSPNVWRLAGHFKITREADYIADRFGSNVISEDGAACAHAHDRARCESDLALPGDVVGHHLVTVEGDSVRLWIGPAALVLFGEIDTTAEAIWLVVDQAYDVRCDTKVYDTGDGGYSVEANRVDMGCLDAHAFVNVRVRANGAVEEGETTRVEGAQTNCGASR